MKKALDLEKAAEAELAGALAVCGSRRRPVPKALPLAKIKPLLALLIEVAQQAGASRHSVQAGPYRLRIRPEGSLLIRRPPLKRAA